MTSLYDQIGGAPALHEAVKRFYEKLMADRRIAPFFAGVDMIRQSIAQERFLAALLRGEAADPAGYMRRAHRRLVEEHGLSDAHFDAVAEHLAATLSELGVPEAGSAQIMSAVENLRDAVLGRDRAEARRLPA